jgi:hypothetical protein
MLATEDRIECSAGLVRLYCPWLENPFGLVTLWDMIELEAGHFIDSLIVTGRLEELLGSETDRNKLQLSINALKLLGEQCQRLGLGGAGIKARAIVVLWEQGVPLEDVRANVRELLSRIRDEAVSVCFYHISADKSPFLIQQEPIGLMVRPNQIRIQRAPEYFGQSVTIRFPSLHVDLREAIKCFVFECFPACAFHMMRAADIGIPKIAKLCGIEDRSPSWGTILTAAEKLTQKTQYKDLPETLKPHIEFLKSIIADMRSMQHARNKISHSEDSTDVTRGSVDREDAYDLVVATRSFLRRLTEGLPKEL